MKDHIRLTKDELATLLTIIDFFINRYVVVAKDLAKANPQDAGKYDNFHRKLLDLKQTIVNEIFKDGTITTKLQ